MFSKCKKEKVGTSDSGPQKSVPVIRSRVRQLYDEADVRRLPLMSDFLAGASVVGCPDTEFLPGYRILSFFGTRDTEFVVFSVPKIKKSAPDFLRYQTPAGHSCQNFRTAENLS